MHAARYANGVEVFSSALELVKALTKPDVVNGLSELETGVSQLRQWDMNDMNLLHHGAEGCAEEMLSEVGSAGRGVVFRSWRQTWSKWSRGRSAVEGVCMHLQHVWNTRVGPQLTQ